MPEQEKKDDGSAAPAIGWGGHIGSLLGMNHGIEHALPFLGPVGSFMGAAGAGIESYELFKEGRTMDGFMKGGEAVLDAGAGVAESIALGTGGAAAAGTAVGAASASSVAAAVLGGAALGIGAGMGIEGASKYSGIYHDDQGRPVSGMEKVAGWGNNVAQWIDPSKTEASGAFHPGGGTGPGLFDGNFSKEGALSTLATTAGLGTTILGDISGVGPAMDVIGTGAAAAKWIGSLFGGDDKKSDAPPATPAQKPIPTVNVQDLPQVGPDGKPIPTVDVNDLPQVGPDGKPIPTVDVNDLPQVGPNGKPIPTVNVEDLPKAR